MSSLTHGEPGQLNVSGEPRGSAEVAEYAVLNEPANKRTLGSFVGGTLLNLAALGGAAFIVLIILSAVFNITLIMFKTGSMSPTIPAGSLAVVKEIPATEIQVGDVLTVDRGARLPVTHRVTSIEGEGDERTITMKGDANESEDPLPYTVTQARLVLTSVPGLAHVVVWFSNPVVLGALTLATSALVTWAFWPKRQRRH
ncbi:signal peptidase I [Leucobacter sp. HY1910]